MTTEVPWHAAYPAPRNSNPSSISRQELLQRLEAGQTSGGDFLLVDLRRTDFEGGTIQGALNLPAQSIYESLGTLYSLCKATKVTDIVWWCGSSRGRGPRVAGWFDDLLVDRGEQDLKSLVLEGGIKGWATAGPQYQRFMVGYDRAAWET